MPLRDLSAAATAQAARRVEPSLTFSKLWGCLCASVPMPHRCSLPDARLSAALLYATRSHLKGRMYRQQLRSPPAGMQVVSRCVAGSGSLVQQLWRVGRQAVLLRQLPPQLRQCRPAGSEALCLGGHITCV